MPIFVSVYVNDVQRSIYIASDGNNVDGLRCLPLASASLGTSACRRAGGRVCRPLIIVENGRPLVQDKHIKELAAVRDLSRVHSC